MKSIFRYPKTFVGIFILFALITVKYQNCAPIPEGSGSETNDPSTSPFPTGTWNGQSGSVSSVNMSVGAMPSYIFPGSTVAVTVTVTGAGTLNVAAGANGNTSQGNGYFTTSCTCSGNATTGSGGACGTTTGGTVILTCNVTPYGYNSGTPSGNTYIETVPIYATVEDGTQTTLQTCSSATGVCSGTYAISAPTLPIYYQIGNACYNLQYLGDEFVMQASGQSTVYINSQYMEQYGFTDCSSGLCCDTSGRCFNTSGVYDNSYSPGTCF